MCKVSVIIGVYNPNLHYFKLAIESILSQTYSDFELLLCDDGSSDDIKSEIIKLANKDNRIKIIFNECNSGLAFSLNRCLSYATGEFIARMDDDDISKTTRFETQLRYLKEHPGIDFVGTNIEYIDDNNKKWGERILKEFPENKDFLWNSPFVHPSIMIRSSVLKSVNGYRVENRTRRTEDYDLWMRLYAAGFRGANIQKTLLQYREGKTGLKRRKFKYRLDESYVRYEGFKLLKLFPKGLIFVMKPIVVGLVPNQFISFVKRR